MDDELLNDPELADPDGEDGDAKYSWDEDFQKHILSLLISDRQFLLSSLDIIKPNYFTNKVHKKVCQIVFSYFKKYRVIPRKDFIIQEMKTSLKDNKALSYYLAEFNVVVDYFQPGLDSREYLQDKITYFAKIQAVRKAFHDSLKEIDKNPESEETWQTVYDKMRDAMTTHQNFEVGIDYFNTFKDRYVAKEEDDDNDRFITGIDSIDIQINGGGYIRGEIIGVVAGSGVGKSVFLSCLTAINILRGKNGVYISLELAEKKIADRFDSIFTEFPIQKLSSYKEDVFEKLDSLEIDRTNKFGSLIIKAFPAGTASVNTIRAYLSQLRFHGFNPDFVIVDYVGEMQGIPGLPTHESMEKIVRDLRGMGSEEKVFVATAMQPNRDYKNDKGSSGPQRIDDKHLAGSFGQIRPLDGCFSLNQNDTEKELGIGRGYVIKQRDGESRYQFFLKFNKENLKITEMSSIDYRKALNLRKEYASQEIEMDQISDDNQWPTGDEQ
jgi:hypothetical protein